MTKIGARGLILIAVLAVAVWALPRSAQAQGCGGSPVGRCLDDIGMDPTQFMRGLESFFPQGHLDAVPGRQQNARHRGARRGVLRDHPGALAHFLRRFDRISLGMKCSRANCRGQAARLLQRRFMADLPL